MTTVFPVYVVREPVPAGAVLGAYGRRDGPEISVRVQRLGDTPIGLAQRPLRPGDKFQEVPDQVQTVARAGTIVVPDESAAPTSPPPPPRVARRIARRL